MSLAVQTPGRLLEAELRQALDQGQFRLTFQPRTHLSTGRLMGFETLLRWEHPTHGVVSPSEFFPMAEQCGLAATVARWMLEQAIVPLGAWEAEGHHGLQLAFNMPLSLFSDSDFSQFLNESLQRHEIAGNQVELEFGEQALGAAGPEVIAQLQSLRKHGVTVTINDFGAGGSHFPHLTRLPLDGLKLNLRAVQSVTSVPADALLARMSCELARALKVRVLVDGIETEGQMQFFAKLRCDMAQGPFFSAALKSDEATAMLHAGGRFAIVNAPVDHAGRHLLLLDDEPNILRSLRRAFRGQSYTVHTANTPDEAFELLACHPIGVVMSDQRMPLMRGTEFLARVKQLYPDTVRIVLSGYTELQSITGAINEGFIYKFLTKPWNDAQLAEEIEQAFVHHEIVAEGQHLQERLRETHRELEARLRQNEARLLREEVALDVSYEALNVVPVPIMGVDSQGMIALSNAAADQLLGGGSSLVGEPIGEVLPEAAAVLDGTATCNSCQLATIEGHLYHVKFNALGRTSRGSGTVITLLKGASA